MDKEPISASQAQKELKKASGVLQKICEKEQRLFQKFAKQLDYTVANSTSKTKLYKIRDTLRSVREQKTDAKLLLKAAKKLLRAAKESEKRQVVDKKFALIREKEREKALKQFMSSWDKAYDQKPR